MLGLLSYLAFLGLLGLVMWVATNSTSRDRVSANAAAAMLAARLH
jgi:hypothetical protein